MTKNLNITNIFKFRVIIDTELDVFRDIEIASNAPFEKLHEAILSSFDFEHGEMASFYMSNETWEKGLEIPLMHMAGDASISMKSATLEEMVNKPSDKVLYIYDFMRMWIFYVELMEIKKDNPGTIYPCVTLVYGEAPSQDSKEMDLFGTEFSEEEFNEIHGDVKDTDGEEEEGEDMFDADEEFFDESEFNGSFGSYDDHS